ncbi:hypothetical protein OIU84_030286 [Salix udensis]|uniref:Protein kinase domain-containing protein n=1 Tax=Salix udensis TaxID=889485 RepID=A0AAD6P8V7_9ROSI|nr:hypothetical protein OIU84_030286 [Salix udensis]
MKTANVANNELEGPIPESLSRLTPNSFAGNKGLCGPPLGPCMPSPPSSTPEARGKKISILYIVIIILIVLLLLAAIAFAFLLFSRNKRRAQRRAPSPENSNRMMSSYCRDDAHREMPETNSRSRKTDPGKLSFLKDDIEKFDLQDLLTASAEVLGSGTFGSSYKAAVGGQPVVVKRYRHMNNVEREEFHEHMRRIGRLKHQNLLPLAAYYYRRDEKLLVTEFAENGSLASHLHGKLL